MLRPPVLLGAAVGGVLALLWVRRRAALAAVAGVIAVVVFAAFATVGLPINTRYGFLADAILCIFCGAGVFGWKLLQRGDPHRRMLADRGRGGGGGARGLRPRDRQIGPPANWTNWPPSTASKTNWWRSSNRHAVTLAVRPRGRAQPRTDPAAGAVPEDQPGEDRQPRGRPDQPRRVPGGEPAGAARLRAGPARPALGGPPSRRLRRGPAPTAPGGCSSAADDDGPCTPLRDARHPAPAIATDSAPGAPAAPGGDRLRLLPSGPDLVREPTSRGTRTINAPGDGATGAGVPRGGLQPR